MEAANLRFALQECMKKMIIPLYRNYLLINCYC